MEAEKKLFIYGSFVKGQPHFDFISDYIFGEVPAKMMAAVYRLPVGYPALCIPSDEAMRQWVEGCLVSLKAPELALKLVDEFHMVSPLDPSKGLYLKSEQKVMVGEEVQEATVYLLNPQKLPVDAELIQDGNWQRDMQDRPGMNAYLSDKHRIYLKKLAAVKGRQVVPYDLNLSRDLMKMGLIVDKGRRLALSKLGKELVRYMN